MLNLYAKFEVFNYPDMSRYAKGMSYSVGLSVCNDGIL